MLLSSSSRPGANSALKRIGRPGRVCGAFLVLCLLTLPATICKAEAAPYSNSSRVASGDDGATLPAPQPGYHRTPGKNTSSDGPDTPSPASRRPGRNVADVETSAMPDKGPPPPEGPPRTGGWQGGHGHHHGGGLFGGPLDLSSLNLTDEQKQTIRQLRSQNAPKARELRRSMQAKRSELRTMMFDPNASDDAIRAKRRELRAMQDQMEDMVLSDFLSMRSVLTPEQRKKLPEVMPNRTEFARRPGGQPSADAGVSSRKKMVEGAAPPVD